MSSVHCDITAQCLTRLMAVSHTMYFTTIHNFFRHRGTFTITLERSFQKTALHLYFISTRSFLPALACKVL